MFFTCPFTMQVWILIGLWNDIQQIVSDTSLEEKSISCCYNVSRQNWMLVWLVCFGVYGSTATSKCRMMLQR